jgi:RNA polymerase sigma factor (sigma-70 family)
MLIDDIIKIQDGDNDLTTKLIEKFNPLLKKYTYKLHYEDAYHDLIADFIEILLGIKAEKIRNKEDGCIFSYLTVCIHSCYVKRLIKIKQMRNIITYSDLTEKELHYIDTLTSTNDTYIKIDLELLRKVLTYQEYMIIKMIFYEGYSVAETANVNGITRQAINQMKNRALKKLKIVFEYKN